MSWRVIFLDEKNKKKELSDVETANSSFLFVCAIDKVRLTGMQHT